MFEGFGGALGPTVVEDSRLFLSFVPVTCWLLEHAAVLGCPEVLSIEIMRKTFLVSALLRRLRVVLCLTRSPCFDRSDVCKLLRYDRWNRLLRPGISARVSVPI